MKVNLIKVQTKSCYGTSTLYCFPVEHYRKKENNLLWVIRLLSNSSTLLDIQSVAYISVCKQLINIKQESDSWGDLAHILGNFIAKLLVQ